MARTFGQPVPVERPETTPAATPAANLPRPRKSRFAALAVATGITLSLFWLGTGGAFVWGWLGPRGLNALDMSTKALIAAALLLPPFLFVAVSAALARSAAMSEATRLMLAATEKLFSADETAANNAARLVRAVRRELDGLNTGLDVAFQRMRTLEAVLEKQISTLDDAGARADVRGQTIAARLNQESNRLESLGDALNESAGRAAEAVAGRAAQLRATMESAEGTLKMATQGLEVQTAGFRAAVTAAADAPLEAAKALEAHATRIEEVSDSAMGRAEFVLARQEKHRAQMQELAQRLKDESDNFETMLARQQAGMENAIAELGGEAKKFEMVTGDAERHLELIMANAAQRAAQLTGAFAREAEHLKEVSEAAAGVLAALSGAMRDAGEGARTLIGESAEQAKHDARLLVGEAMAECERLLRTAGEMSAEAGKIRALLSETTRDVEKHLIRLPGLAQEEARRVRQTMAQETEQLLDLSARTMSTLHARSTGKVTTPDMGGPMKPETAENAPEGLKGLARKLTAKKPDAPRGAKAKDAPAWEMKTLLAAAEQGDMRSLPRSAGPDHAATLGALELALADIAIDLSALDDAQPGDEDWKRYLAGDRAVFARRLADAIDEEAVDRIATLYRDDTRFHGAADAYLAEFERLLTRAREGDSGGILTSTLLSADTGKVYLTIAYALGRL
jgi:hypothetical protein